MFMTDSYEDKLKNFKKLIEESKKIVFFGGAGVSTSSGIPDFRSANGLYNNVDEDFKNYRPEELLSAGCFNHSPKVFYKFYRKYLDARKYEPNIVHKTLAKWEQDEKLIGIVTQNIDMLHEKAGSKKIYKIHGTIGKNHCIQCGETYDIDYVFDNKELLPHCCKCNGNYNLVKPNVVLYDEVLPKMELQGAENVIAQADLLIIAGTSLMVEPAASLVKYYFGKNMVILNMTNTPYDKYADVVFHEDMSKVFEDLQKM